ncbi:UNVERIFIED_CONTAM: hypothetical protein K2H54_047802 [Gekko kuhli]
MEVVIPFVLIIISYAFIFYTIIKIPSAVRKCKAFSTCGSHICVVVLFYGAVSWVYFKPNSKNPNSNNTVATVVYTMMIPMLNPYIYSLRNREMKAAMKSCDNGILPHDRSSEFAAAQAQHSPCPHDDPPSAASRGCAGAEGSSP